MSARNIHKHNRLKCVWELFHRDLQGLTGDWRLYTVRCRNLCRDYRCDYLLALSYADYFCTGQQFFYAL